MRTVVVNPGSKGKCKLPTLRVNVPTKTCDRFWENVPTLTYNMCYSHIVCRTTSQDGFFFISFWGLHKRLMIDS